LTVTVKISASYIPYWIWEKNCHRLEGNQLVLHIIF